MSESEAPKRRGRPPTGITPHRKVRIEDEIWNEVERLAAELAAHEGLRPNVTAYVKEALRRENTRVERLLRRQTEDQADANMN